MAARFADPGEFLDEIEAEPEPDEDSVEELRALQERIANLDAWLDRIPRAEADAVELTLLGKRQAEIAAVFGVTQAAISYRLHRALERLRYLSTMPDLTDDLESLLPEVIKDETTLKIVRLMWVVTSQSHVATELKVTQGRVRHRFFKAVEAIEHAAKADPKFERMAKALRKLSLNYNILQEILIPRDRR